MKYRFYYDFEVELSVKDVDVQLGKSKDEMKELSSFELRDLFVNGTEETESGEIHVCDEYANEPDLYVEDGKMELYATFAASCEIDTEGKDYEECFKNAEEKFSKLDFGDYEFVDGGKLDYKYDRIDLEAVLPEITADDISEYLDINGYDTQSADKEMCQEIADLCNLRYMEDYKEMAESNPTEVPLKEEMLETIIGEKFNQRDAHDVPEL